MTGIEDIILRLAAVAGALTALGYFAMRLWRATKAAVQRLVITPIVNEVRAATYPIQPTANGGNSLPDAIAILRRLDSRQTDIGDRLARVEGAVQTHLDWHNH